MMKGGIVVAVLLAGTASAAFLGRHEVREALTARGLLTRIQTVEIGRGQWARPVLPASLTIQGEVVGGGSTSGTLLLRVGSVVSTSPITVSPGYSFVIAGAKASDMVSIEIVTPTYKYASLLGSYDKLARHAGSDAYLTTTELDRIRASAFSTSLYYFTQRELGGRLPVSDSEHERAVRSVAGDDLATAASALEDLFNGDAVLPTGYANGYELVQDQAGYRAFLAQYGYGPFPALMAAPSVPILQGQLGANTLLSSPVFPMNDVGMFGNAQILSRTNLGWASYGQSKRNALVTPQFLASGELELTPQGDVYSESFQFKQVDPSQPPNSQVRERRTLVRDVYRQIFVGETYRLWAVRSDWEVTYPDYPWVASEFDSNTGMVAVSKLDGLPAYRAAELVGQRALPVFCKQGSPLQLGICESAVQRFRADGSGYSENVGSKVDPSMGPFDPMGGEPFQWRNGRGPLELTYSDASVTYWRIDQGDEAVDVLVYIARSPDGADTLTTAGRAAMINADVPGDFSDLNAVGTWRYASFEQFKQPYGYHPDLPPVTARFLRAADNTTVRSELIDYDLPDGQQEFRTRYGWSVLDNMLYETRYRANASTGISGTVGFSSCAQAYARGATQCAPQQVRYFLPLARVGNRLYGIQEIYQQTTSYTAPFAPTRASYPSYIEKL